MSRITGTEEVGKLLRALDENKSLVHFRKMHQENVELKNEIDELVVVNKSNDKKLIRLLADIEESKQQAQDKATKLESTLKQKQELATKQTDTMRQLREAMEELSVVKKELNRLKGFTIELKPTPPTLSVSCSLYPCNGYTDESCIGRSRWTSCSRRPKHSQSHTSELSFPKKYLTNLTGGKASAISNTSKDIYHFQHPTRSPPDKCVLLLF